MISTDIYSIKLDDLAMISLEMCSLECQVASALDLTCRSFRGLDLRLKPTELDVSQQELDGSWNRWRPGVPPQNGH